MVTENTEMVVEAKQTQELQDERKDGEDGITHDSHITPALPEEDTPITMDEVVEAEMLNTLAATSFSIDNSDRIAAIKRAIANGTYRIDPRRIAEKILSFEFLLGRRDND